ncbi:MAG TPA: CRTAC1 family protein [Planctomycetes bacterium]|nr:CRTAC1 family protein [Planctomycetota bacterium]
MSLRGIPTFLLIVLAASCGGSKQDSSTSTSAAPSTGGDFAPSFDFADETIDRGIDFVNDTGATGKRWMPEQLGGGAAFFDCDGDGDQDLLLINCGPLPGSESPKDNVLYINDGTGFFRPSRNPGDITAGADYGVGAAVADVDLDGDLDVFLTNWGLDRLYLNDGKGTFTRADDSGITSHLWGASAAFGDLDGDGLPDLYVVNYVDYDIAKHSPCFQRDIEVYCGPQPFNGQPDFLFKNLGGGKFKDVTRKAFPGKPPAGKGLGCAMADYDHDGDLDIYVTNDQTPNLLFKNDGHGVFEEIGELSGVAVSRDGMNEAGMGVVFSDYDNDLLEDIVVTNFEDQTYSVFHNEGDDFWMEVSWETGIGYETRPRLGWGIGLLDFDHDGWKDLFFANGHIYDNARKINDASRWKQPNTLHRNLGNGKFAKAAKIAALAKAQASRAAAFADIDNDGDMDILVTNIDDRPQLLVNRRNETPGSHFALIATAHPKAGTPILGARIVITANGMSQSQTCQGTYSIFSSNDPRAHFGLASSPTIDTLDVHWIGGAVDHYESLPADHLIVLVPGKEARIVDLASGKVQTTKEPKK